MATHDLPLSRSPTPAIAAGEWIVAGIWNALVAAALGALMVATILPVPGLAAILWVITLTLVYRRLVRQGRPKLAVTMLGLQSVVVCGAFAAAIVAPGKTRDEVLAQPILLPSRSMTMGELQRYLEGPDRPREAVPTHIWLTFAEEDANMELRFPSQRLSLKLFVAAMESQTPLRARFASCGNGYTVLKGEDCCFGLSLRDRGQRD